MRTLPRNSQKTGELSDHPPLGGGHPVTEMQTGESFVSEYKECRHIMPSGLHCKSPAMRGGAFCYFHGRAPRPTRPARPLESNIEVSPVDGSRGCALACNQIMQALAANRISTRRAAILLQGVQMASGQVLPGPIELDAPLGSMLPRNSQPHLHSPKE